MPAPEVKPRVVQVYRSRRRPETFLYMDATTPLGEVPQALCERLGELEALFRFWLTPDRQLARMAGQAVLAAISAQGYYLQLPDRENPLEEQLARLAGRAHGSQTNAE